MLYRRRVIPRRLEELWGLRPGWPRPWPARSRATAPAAGRSCGRGGWPRSCSTLYPVGSPPAPARSLAGWVGHPRDPARSASPRSTGSTACTRQLCRPARPSAPPTSTRLGAGSIVDGVRSEDLTRLTYPDDSFDLVLTSETLEHVPDLDAALARDPPRAGPRRPAHLHDAAAARSRRDIPPVRRPAGRLARAPRHRRSATRAATSAIPVFTEFGADLPDILRRPGFEVDVHFGPTTRG